METDTVFLLWFIWVQTREI